MKKRGTVRLILLVLLLAAIVALSVAAVKKLLPLSDDKQQGSSADISSAVSDKPMPTGKLIDAKHIYQLDKWPTGCESVSAVMALNYAGVDISVDYFIDNCLTITDMPFNPYKSFGGNPRDKSGFGCYAPVIKEALDKALENSEHKAKLLNNVSLDELCEKYIVNDIPVIFWGTLDMAEPFEGKTWEFEGESFTWIRPEHCLLLIGYDRESYAFCDPMHEESVTYYSKAATERSYAALHSQAIIIE